MTQTWDPQAYAQNAAFVPGLAGEVLDWLAAQPGEHVLDLGCGDGQLTRRIAATGASVVGIDASPEMVAAAQAGGIVAELGDAEALPFAPGSFDAVFSNAALHWVRDQDAMLTEVHRVLKRGGRFVAEMGGHGNVAAIRIAFQAVLARHGHADRQGDENYYPTAEAYSRRLERHGFRVDRMTLFPRPTPLPSQGDEPGMSVWLRTFRRGVLQGLPEALRATVVEETVAFLAPVLCDQAGHWTADYVRLRFIAMAA